MRSREAWTALIVSLLGFAAGASPAGARNVRQEAALARLPLSFIENRGQADPHVAYYVQDRDKTLSFTAQALTFLLHSKARGAEPPDALRLEFVGAARDVQPRAEARTPAVVSYFQGQPASWRAGIPTYSRLVYPDLWPGIDLIFSGAAGRLKYELLVRPGADPRRIRLAYRGATRLAVNARGELEVETPAGSLHDARPVSFQTVGGRAVEVATAYDLDTAGGSHGFRLGAYDPRLPLLIDPEVFVYAGFFGRNFDPEFDYDACSAVAVDGAGNAYAACISDYHPPGSSSTLVYVAKINAAGTAVLWTAYFQGVSWIADLAIDAAGNVYVAGDTTGTGFPAVSGPDTSFNGGASDGFVAKLDAAGTSLLYAGFVGGSGSDRANSIAVDGAGNAYVAGVTNSTETTFPDGDGFGGLPGPDTTYNGSYDDGFFVKVNAAGTAFLNAGYIGGAGLGTDGATDVAVDSTGNAYLAGTTMSTQATFPDGDGFGALSGPDTTHNGLADAFIAKIDAAGTAFLYAGYVGGASYERAAGGLAVAPTGEAYLVGTTQSTEATFPDGDGFGALTGADTTHNGGMEDAFVAKVNAAGAALVWASYLGGSSTDEAFDVALDTAGNAYVVGHTGSTQATLPDGDGFGGLTGPDTTYNLNGDGFVVKVAASGTPLLFATYIGGSSVDTDDAFGVAVDGAGAAYVVGQTHSSETSFPDGDGIGGLPSFDPDASAASSGFLLKISGPDRPADFFTLTPCRLVDTRDSAGPQGGPALAPGVERTFPLAGTCGIPAQAVAVALNVSAVSATDDGDLQVYAADTAPPAGSVVIYRAGPTRARSNNAMVRLGAAGAVSVRANQPAGTVHLVLDVVGYYLVSE